MEVNLQCDIQILNDTRVMGSMDVICKVISKAREILQDNVSVSMYEDFIEFKQHLIFKDLGEFNNWLTQRFPNIDC